MRPNFLYIIAAPNLMCTNTEVVNKKIYKTGCLRLLCTIYIYQNHIWFGEFNRYLFKAKDSFCVWEIKFLVIAFCIPTKIKSDLFLYLKNLLNWRLKPFYDN